MSFTVENPSQEPQVALHETARTGFVAESVSLLKNLAVLVVLAVLLRASVVEAFKIPSSSMEPTLQIGDHILVNKLSYGLRLLFFTKSVWQTSLPRRGDIVVFTLPDDPRTSEDESATNLIKRVIGLPGDRIEVKRTRVYINGAVYAEDDKYARWLSGGVKDFPLVTVPEGRVFLLGDNRDYSKDARFWVDPFLEIGRIKGRAFIIYYNSRGLFGRIFTVLH